LNEKIKIKNVGKKIRKFILKILFIFTNIEQISVFENFNPHAAGFLQNAGELFTKGDFN
jgi:hypothetical protein